MSLRPMPRTPTLDEWRAWLVELVEAHRREEIGTDELVELLGQVRRATWTSDTGTEWARDVLLLAATERPAEQGGASLPQLAVVFNKNRKAEQVNGPRQVLVRLRQDYRTAADYLAAIQRRTENTDD